MERNIEIQKYNLEAKIYEERRKTEEKLDDMLQNIQTNNHQIRNVEQRIEDISQIRDIGRPYLNLTNETGIKFSGNIKNLHPRVYINSLKHKLRSVNNINDIKDYIRMTLSDNAATWFASIENDLDNLQTFENKFLNYYWGELEQARFREVLYFGKYNRNVSLNTVDYALKLITVAKYLEPPLREDETVLNVSRHFDADVVQTVTVQNIQTVDSFINFIQRVQRGYITSNNSKNRQSYNNNRYGSNSQNFNNNNNTSYERQGNRENFNNNTNDNRQERQGNRENFNNNNNYNRQDFNTRRNAQRYNYNRQVNYVRGQSCEDSQRNSTWQENMNSRSESSERHRELDPNDQTQSDNPNNPNFM
ncbi:GATA zinc finger domain-containing protein 4-like [Diabrotica virgifera virgifera]|uniref:GATA zinc finger domain-containing protein 14-like n=1 Tax=Diabrotica virgifera virgifera TaxID=50390 RepID=A0ABM5L1A7_DIAVI|nr:GATA zinc finger domain-containing protein 4-like [Diabrotica virgifera virgifera]